MLTRRDLLISSGALLLAPWSKAASWLPVAPQRIGLLTDIHYADAPARGTRFYRESLPKIEEARQHFQTEKIDALIELGDLIDSADQATAEDEMRFLKAALGEISQMSPVQRFTLGNHCLAKVKRADFLQAVGQKTGHTTLELDHWKAIILDACHKADGTPYDAGNFVWTDTSIPDWQIDWLRQELSNTKKHVLVCVHQRIDWTGASRPSTGVASAAKVRQAIDDAKNVRIVLQGHTHENAYVKLAETHYVTLRAVVEGTGQANNGYGVLSLYEDGSALLHGQRDQLSRKL
ncbi:MAG: metallophosphoesterase [Fimbriimonadaceae bacterium]|nr:metallophosphoesterase [Fimbriimonadaceae bacterium]